ncbi:MAG: PilZ domain-containing protein [Candidatus Methylomirabilales bacterium]
MAQSQERRGVPRMALVGRPGARARETLEVWLADLSATGARITLGELLHHGSACSLQLPPGLGSLTLSARVVWSAIYGGEQTLEGERHVIYQSGLAFVDLTTDQQAALAEAVERVSSGTPLPDGRLPG